MFYSFNFEPTFNPVFLIGETFKEAIEAFDHLYVNFDDQNCNINRPEKFESAFQVWYDYAIKPNGPFIWIGLASDPRNTQNQAAFLKRDDAPKKLEVIRCVEYFKPSRYLITV